MATGRELHAALKARGVRLTRQRQLILEALASLPGHISADLVFQRVVEQFPDVNISTVYRTLELLQELGLVRHTHFDDGVAQYHLAHEPAHQHLVCRACGAERELDMALLEPVAARLRAEYGFEPDLAHFAIVGLCRECRGRGEERSTREAAGA